MSSHIFNLLHPYISVCDVFLVSFLPPHVSQRGWNRQTVKSVLGRM